MASKKRKSIKKVSSRKKSLKKSKVKRKAKRVIGIFDQPKKAVKKRTKRKIKGVTELRRYAKGHPRAGLVKSVSMILYNKRKGKDALDKFADDIAAMPFNSMIDKIYYRNKGKDGKTILPFASVVIVEQRDRRDPRNFHYEPYFMKPPATKFNIRNHTINTVRNHGEFIRLRIVKMGYTEVKYDFSNFNPWHVPSIRIELLYQ